MGLGAPLALLGLLAAGIPVLLHRIRRRDLPRRKLPTIALLKSAQAESRRRHRLADILLLASRIALLALACLGAAAPFVYSHLAYGDGRVRSVAIVLDDSMSMRRGKAGRRLFERAAQQASEAIDALPSGSEVAIVAAGTPTRVLVPLTPDKDAAQAALASARLESYRGTDLREAVDDALLQLRGATNQQRGLLVLSDFASHARLEHVRWPQEGVEIDARKLSASAAEGNFAITGVRAVPDPTTEGKASIAVEVRSYGKGSDSVPLKVTRQGKELARTRIVLRDGLGQATLHVPLPDDTDDPAARAVLETSDALAADNERGLLLRTDAAHHTLIVNGDPHPSDARDEVRFLMHALRLAPANDAAPFAHRTIDPDVLEHHPLDGVDVIVLANAPCPQPSTTQRLLRFVKNGGGLLIAPGSHFDVPACRSRLKALLPGRPTGKSSEPVTGMLPGPAATHAPGVEAGLQQVETRERLIIDAHSDAQAMLVFPDDLPALLQQRVGKGRVALLATTLDDDWTDLPYRPGYLPLMARAIRGLGSARVLPDRPFHPGRTVAIPIPPGARRMEVIGPDGEQHALSVGGSQQLETPFGETHLPGVYRVRTAGASEPLSHAPRLAFVVAPPANESDPSAGEPPASSTSQTTAAGAGVRVPRSLTIWFLLAAAVMALIEGWLRLDRRLPARLPLHGRHRAGPDGIGSP